MNNGDIDNDNQDRENSRPSDQSGRKNEKGRGAEKIIALTGLGVRVEILAQRQGNARCRRLQDGKEIIVPTKELIRLRDSDPIADKPRELFQHSGIRWHDPAEPT
jgi:hypothetical protein